MITREEILGQFTCPPELEANLKELLEKVNKLRLLWAKPMKITSGFRSWEHHCKVYRDKGILTQKEMEEYIKIGNNIKNSKIPTKSKHLYCLAIDVYDPKFELTKFCKDHSKEMEEIGLWFEDDISVPRLHIQIRSVASGVRWFKPK